MFLGKYQSNNKYLESNSADNGCVVMIMLYRQIVQPNNYESIDAQKQKLRNSCFLSLVESKALGRCDPERAGQEQSFVQVGEKIAKDAQSLMNRAAIAICVSSNLKKVKRRENFLLENEEK